MSTSAIIGSRNAWSASHDGPRRSWPAKNTEMAKGNVSRSGAFDEMSPSRLSPLRRLKKEPVLSPTRHMNPRNEPRMKAVGIEPPIANHASPEPARGEAKTLLLSPKAPALVPSFVATTMSMHSRPDVSDPPIKPFHVFPSPSILFPSLSVRPPSMGHGP